MDMDIFDSFFPDEIREILKDKLTEGEFEYMDSPFHYADYFNGIGVDVGGDRWDILAKVVH